MENGVGGGINYCTVSTVNYLFAWMQRTSRDNGNVELTRMVPQLHSHYMKKSLHLRWDVGLELPSLCRIPTTYALSQSSLSFTVMDMCLFLVAC